MGDLISRNNRQKGGEKHSKHGQLAVNFRTNSQQHVAREMG
jgi:hypothetical protein